MDTEGMDQSQYWEEVAYRRLKLLKRLIEHEGMIVFAAPRCMCGDCELVREIEKELLVDPIEHTCYNARKETDE